MKVLFRKSILHIFLQTVYRVSLGKLLSVENAVSVDDRRHGDPNRVRRTEQRRHHLDPQPQEQSSGEEQVPAHFRLHRSVRDSHQLTAAAYR